MKAEGLMIGDWVHLINTIHDVTFPENGVIQDEGYTTICTPIKITTVSEKCVSYYSNKFESYITLSNEDIEPIPLTTEILEKNGFEKHISDMRMFFHHDEYCLSYYLENKHFTIYNMIDGSLIQRVIVNTHELQHALKLCGIDKEIKV